MKRTEAEYLEHDFFGPSEGPLACHTKKFVTARKAHVCRGVDSTAARHTIAVGERHLYERALVDGSYWGAYRTCTRCLDKDMDKFEQ